eukprot:296264_1
MTTNHRSYHETIKSKFVALNNLGHTGYINCILYQLFMIDEFRYYIMNAGVNIKNKDSLVYQLCRMFSFLSLSERSVYDTADFCNIWKDEFDKPVNVNQPGVCTEFFDILCGRIQKELENTVWASMLQKCIQGQIIVLGTCQHCHDVRSRILYFKCLSVPIGNCKNIHQSLSHFIQENTFSETHHNTCGMTGDFVKREMLQVLPNTIFLELKRFKLNFDTYDWDKINSYFEFPMDLTLKPYMPANAQEMHDVSYFQYTLVGVVIHNGTTQEGQVYSIVRNQSSIRGLLLLHGFIRENVSASIHIETNIMQLISLFYHYFEWIRIYDDRIVPCNWEYVKSAAFGGIVEKVDIGIHGAAESIDSLKCAQMLVYQRKVTAPNQEKSRFMNLNEVEVCVQRSETIWSDIINDNKSLQHHYTFIKVSEDSEKIHESNINQSYICSKQLSNCLKFINMKKTMYDYQMTITKSEDKNFVDTIDMKTVLDNFLHLMNAHDTDEEYEKVMNELPSCKLGKCQIIKQHFRSHESELCETNRHICYDLLNKIHCFYKHSIDTGNRLSITVKSKLVQQLQQCEQKDDMFINHKLLSINKLLNDKRKSFNNIDELNQRYRSTANKFVLSKAIDVPKTNNNYSELEKMYSFGQLFCYGYHDEYVVERYEPIIVNRKFSTLKEELTSNDIHVISIEMFNAEYKKAKLHFNSFYRKQIHPHILLHHVLCLMIYCNFDALQYEFSKTYRDNIHQHNNFYHLGKYLKISVRKFGCRISDNTSFYHGISEQLSFPIVIGDSRYSYASHTSIFCPLSTSTAFEVAVNFTNHNNGLVIEFGYGRGSRCFSVAWLSAFPNEREHFFLNETFDRINNIVHLKNGLECKSILKALDMLNCCLNYNDKIQKKSDDFKSVNHLIVELIKDQLSAKFPQLYKPFCSLDNYVRKLVSVFCQKKQQIKISHFQQAKAKYHSILELFVHLEHDVLRMDTLFTVFPNITSIWISDINLSSALMETIMSIVENNLKRTVCIWLKPIENSEMSISNTLSLYNNIFSSRDWLICRYAGDFVRIQLNCAHSSKI